MLKLITAGLKSTGKLFNISKPGQGLKSSETGIFSIKNSNICDFFTSNKNNLANGPKSFGRNLKTLGYSKQEYKEILTLLQKNPDLFPIFSRELKDIPKEILNSPERNEILKNIKDITRFLEKKPEAINEFRGYGKFFTKCIKENIWITTKQFLEEGVVDFQTAEKLISSIQKYSKTECSPMYSSVPQILKKSRLPSEELSKLFDSCLAITAPNQLSELICGFSNRILPEINSNHKNLAGLIKQLAETAKSPKCSTLDITSIVKDLKKDWQTEFINKFQSSGSYEPLYKWFELVKDKQQGELVIETLNNKLPCIYNLKQLLKENVLYNEYQQKLYRMLSKAQIHNLDSSLFNAPHRFSLKAQKEILQRIQTESDYELAKLLVEKRSVLDEDLYKTSTIIKVLNQSPEKKLKSLKKLNKPMQYNKSRYEEGLKKTAEKQGYISSDSDFDLEDAKMLSKQIPQKSPFQNQVKILSEKLTNKELLELISPGEAAKAGEKMFINNGNKLVELKIPKETFENLFAGSNHIYQGRLGDCGCIAALDGLMATPKGKSIIYTLFEESKDSKDIYIKLKNGSTIKFPNGEFKQPQAAAGMEVKTPPGLRMLEQAIAASNAELNPKSGIITMYKDFNPHENAEVMQSIKGISPYKILDSIVGKKSYHTIETALPDINSEKLINTINPEKNSFALFAAKSNRSIDSDSWNISPRHWHTCKGQTYDMDLKVSNPHNTEWYAKVPFYELLNPQEIIDEFHIYYLT